MIQNILLPGGGLEFGDEITLSRGSMQRVNMAAEVYYTDYSAQNVEQKIYCTGAYPTLPKGTEPPAAEKREATLMADVLVRHYHIPAKNIEVDADSTTTAQSVLEVAARMAAHQLVRVEEILSEESRLGVVSRPGHVKRITRLFKEFGCMTEFVRPFRVQEDGGGMFDLVSGFAFRASLYGVNGDIQKLLERDSLLESANDLMRTGLSSFKKLVR